MKKLKLIKYNNLGVIQKHKKLYELLIILYIFYKIRKNLKKLKKSKIYQKKFNLIFIYLFNF